MKSEKLKLFSVAVILLLLFGISCTKDEVPEESPEIVEPQIDSTTLNLCDSLIQLGDFLLIPESKDFFIYDSISRVIFKDSEGNLATFTNEMPDDYLLIRNTGTFPCQRNRHEEVDYKHRAEGKYSLLRNDSLQIELKILLRVRLDYTFPENKIIADNLEITIVYLDVGPRIGGNLIVAKREMPIDDFTDVDFNENLELNGKMFQNVYSVRNDFRKIFFTKESGIIGFQEWNQKLWILEKME